MTFVQRGPEEVARRAPGALESRGEVGEGFGPHELEVVGLECRLRQDLGRDVERAREVGGEHRHLDGERVPPRRHAERAPAVLDQVREVLARARARRLGEDLREHRGDPGLALGLEAHAREERRRDRDHRHRCVPGEDEPPPAAEIANVERARGGARGGTGRRVSGARPGLHGLPLRPEDRDRHPRRHEVGARGFEDVRRRDGADASQVPVRELGVACPKEVASEVARKAFGGLAAEDDARLDLRARAGEFLITDRLGTHALDLALDGRADLADAVVLALRPYLEEAVVARRPRVCARREDDALALLELAIEPGRPPLPEDHREDVEREEVGVQQVHGPPRDRDARLLRSRVTLLHEARDELLGLARAEEVGERPGGGFREERARLGEGFVNVEVAREDDDLVAGHV